MRHTAKIATTTIALVTGGLLAATPALAAGFGQGQGNGNGSQASSSSQWGKGKGQSQGKGQGQGRENRGSSSAQQRGASHSANFANVESGTLTAEQRDMLAYMAEEEKLARDVYTALGDKFPTATIFDRIASSEQQHLTTVRTLLDRYDIADPTAGKAAGVFASADIQALYRELSAATTVTQAYQAGVAIEKDDLAELAKADDGVTAPDVNLVYDNLTKASQRHLAAFERQI